MAGLLSAFWGEPEKDNQIEFINEKRLSAMNKKDSLTLFSCYTESAHSYAVFLPESLSVWKSVDERTVRQLCNKLNPLTDIYVGQTPADQGLSMMQFLGLQATGPIVSTRLSDLMKVVREKPDWTTFDYAVACGLTDYLEAQIAKDPELVSSSLSDGPLLFPLLSKKCSGDFEKVIELITTNAPLAVLQADKKGRTIFHHGLDKKKMKCLLRRVYRSIDLDLLRDSSGETPLHCAVDREDLGAVVLLLTYGADVNAVNKKQETPLMKAVMKSNILIVKCLLLFDANLYAKNGSGVDVFTLAASCDERVKIEALLKLVQTGATDTITELNPLESFSQEFAIKYQASETTVEKRVNLLSLDGGGIRGLVLIQILIELERLLGRSIVHSFSWLGGTSTGAILALALSQGKTPSHCRDLYFRLKDEVFTGSRPYNTAPLESLLQEEYGDTTSMGNICLPGKRVLVTTCLGTTNPPELTLYRSYRLPLSDEDNDRLGYGDPFKTTAWAAARCSSAAPTYFPAFEGKWMDGGLVANNPCSELLTDVHNHNMVCRMTGDPSYVSIGCVLSLGTGRARPSSIDTLTLLSEKDPKSNPTGTEFFTHLWKVIAHHKDILLEQITSANGPVVSRARAWTHSLGAPYFRFSPILESDVDLAETRDEILIEMLWTTKEYMASEALSTNTLVEYLRRSTQRNRK